MTFDQQVAGSNPGLPAIECNPGQVANTQVPRTPSSIIWYQTPPFPLAASVSWCWSWEKEGRAVEVWSWHLGCTLEFFHVYSYQDQFIQPGWAECFFCIFSLALWFAYLFVLFDLFISQFFCVSLGSWVISLTVLGASVTNSNEPLIALATSTIMWVRS